jgi:hypothetical protein
MTKLIKPVRRERRGRFERDNQERVMQPSELLRDAVGRIERFVLAASIAAEQIRKDRAAKRRAARLARR